MYVHVHERGGESWRKRKGGRGRERGRGVGRKEELTLGKSQVMFSSAGHLYNVMVQSHFSENNIAMETNQKRLLQAL